MRKQHKKYSKPRMLFDKERILEENQLVKQYGLKNKKEIWNAQSAIDRMKKQAKFLLGKSQAEQEAFLNKLRMKGFNVKMIDDILNLKKEDFLERRLQTLVFKKRIASTPRQARQMVVHKKIMIGENIVNIPSFLVPVELEKEIRQVQHSKKTEPEKKQETKKEIKEEKKEEIKKETEQERNGQK